MLNFLRLLKSVKFGSVMLTDLGNAMRPTEYQQAETQANIFKVDLANSLTPSAQDQSNVYFWKTTTWLSLLFLFLLVKSL